MEQAELQKVLEEIESLKARVAALESIINGCPPKKAGRNPKLSLEQRGEIIQKHLQGTSYSVLAKEYAVCKSTICNICRGSSGLDAPKNRKTFTPMHRKQHTQ